MIVLYMAYVFITCFWMRQQDVRERWAADDWIDRWEPERP